MSKNTGNIDRIIRLIVGAVVLSQVFIGLKTPIGYAGLILIITGLVGFCPIYKVFGLNTCPMNRVN